MMTLPPGFDVSLLVGDFLSFCLPFVSVAVLVTTGIIIIKLLRRS